MKKPSKANSAKPSRKRRAPKKVTEVFEDCAITIQGDKIWISGTLADEIAKAAQKAGMTFQEMFNHCLRLGLPIIVAEHRHAAEEFTAAPAKRKGKATWPKALPERMHAVETALHAAAAPIAPADLAAQFARAKPADVMEILKTLETFGRARKSGEEQFRA